MTRSILKAKFESTLKSYFFATKAQRHEESPSLISSFSLLCEPLWFGVLVAFYYFICFGSRLRFIVFFLILFILPVVFYAQDFEPASKKGTFNIGAEGGIQFTNVSNFASLYEAKSAIGYNIGAFGEYYISNSFKIKAGLSYDNRGFNAYSQNSLLITDSADMPKSYLYYYEVDYKLNYLTIPIGIAFEKGSEKFRLLIQVNFYYSLFLNATMNGVEAYYFDPAEGIDLSETILNQGLNEFSLSGSTEGFARTNVSRDRTSEMITENFNTSDIGFNLLVGVLYNVTPQVGLFVNFGFSYSMGRLFEDPQIDSKWTQITKVNFGVTYSLGR